PATNTPLPALPFTRLPRRLFPPESTWIPSPPAPVIVLFVTFVLWLEASTRMPWLRFAVLTDPSQCTTFPSSSTPDEPIRLIAGASGSGGATQLIVMSRTELPGASTRLSGDRPGLTTPERFTRLSERCATTWLNIPQGLTPFTPMRASRAEPRTRVELALKSIAGTPDFP